jgi:hypothetical protein
VLISFHVSLQFLNNQDRLLTGSLEAVFSTFGRTSWTRNRPVARSLPTQNSTTQRDEANIHVSSGIQTHDPSIQEVKTRQHGHCYWLDRVLHKICIFVRHLLRSDNNEVFHTLKSDSRLSINRIIYILANLKILVLVLKLEFLSKCRINRKSDSFSQL